MRKRRKHAVVPVQDAEASETEAAYRGAVQVWMLRILVHLRGYRRIGTTFSIKAEDIATVLGLELAPGQDADEALNEFSLTHRLRQLEGGGVPEDCVLKRNLDLLTNALEFTATDRAILEFLMLLRLEWVLLATSELIGDSLTLGYAANALGTILGQPVPAIKEALSANGRLRQSGLVHIEKHTAALAGKVMLLSQLIDVISIEHAQPMDILSAFVDPAPPARLAPSDFDDYRRDYELLRRHLRQAAAVRRLGCNILIYGAPGVGKTQLVRTLVADLGMKLFAVTSEDADGDALSTSSRLGAFRLTQHFLARRRDAVILFDEVEDVLAANDFGWLFGQEETNSRKSWLNELLEQNPVPVFWIANSAGRIDPAHLRRFDFVFEMRPMSATARERLLEGACKEKGLSAGGWVKRAAQSPHMSPALIDKITGVVASTRAGEGSDEDAMFERVANGTLEAMGLPPLKLVEKRPLIPYSMDIVNADLDLAGLLAGLRRVKEGRILCYGPPGTGKTAFARQLASELGMRLLEFRASDILGPFVGLTERNIAEAFRAARKEGAMMLLDEIDSLLRSREGAGHSWEVTQVNELLVQMEEFPGILIACTNFPDGLDSAAARRFDRRIGFGYLAGDKAWTLFTDTLKHHGVRLGRGKGEFERRLRALKSLTPGDFQAAVRGAALNAEGLVPESLLAALEAENRTKTERAGRPIGFVAAM